MLACFICPSTFVCLRTESLTEEQQEVVESAAEMLYGLIHARYILTSRGMQAMVSTMMVMKVQG